jgi:hypothetical protein
MIEMAKTQNLENLQNPSKIIEMAKTTKIHHFFQNRWKFVKFLEKTIDLGGEWNTFLFSAK